MKRPHPSSSLLSPSPVSGPLQQRRHTTTATRIIASSANPNAAASSYSIGNTSSIKGSTPVVPVVSHPPSRRQQPPQPHQQPQYKHDLRCVEAPPLPDSPTVANVPADRPRDATSSIDTNKRAAADQALSPSGYQPTSVKPDSHPFQPQTVPTSVASSTAFAPTFLRIQWIGASIPTLTSTVTISTPNLRVSDLIASLSVDQRPCVAGNQLSLYKVTDLEFRVGDYRVAVLPEFLKSQHNLYLIALHALLTQIAAPLEALDRHVNVLENVGEDARVDETGDRVHLICVVSDRKADARDLLALDSLIAAHLKDQMIKTVPADSATVCEVSSASIGNDPLLDLEEDPAMRPPTLMAASEREEKKSRKKKRTSRKDQNGSPARAIPPSESRSSGLGDSAPAHDDRGHFSENAASNEEVPVAESSPPADPAKESTKAAPDQSAGSVSVDPKANPPSQPPTAEIQPRNSPNNVAAKFISALESSNVREEQLHDCLEKVSFEMESKTKDVSLQPPQSLDDSQAADRLRVLESRYLELFEANKRLETEQTKLKKRLDVMNKERSQKQTIEGLCRELQRENKRLNEEVKRLESAQRQWTEQQRQTANLKATPKSSTPQPTSKSCHPNSSDPKTMAPTGAAESPPSVSAAEVQILRDRLKSFIEQYDLRESHFQSMLKASESEIRVLEARLERQRQETREEKAAVKTLSAQVEMFLTTEIDLRNQLQSYVDKFKQVEDTLNKSNGLFGSFRFEMEAMNAKARGLEKENAQLKEMQLKQEQAANASSKVSERPGNVTVLEKLCRVLQLERNELRKKLAKYEGPTAARPPSHPQH
ncbi:myosin-like coiled-coil protein-domain-containing protein [Zopfochytrium polystomum]|nr:myosin-like coiled-coil protein-domain-containing protein [Zopfochytrium polystomum]